MQVHFPESDVRKRNSVGVRERREREYALFDDLENLKMLCTSTDIGTANAAIDATMAKTMASTTDLTISDDFIKHSSCPFLVE